MGNTFLKRPATKKPVSVQRHKSMVFQLAPITAAIIIIFCSGESPRCHNQCRKAYLLSAAECQGGWETHFTLLDSSLGRTNMSLCCRLRLDIQNYPWVFKSSEWMNLLQFVDSCNAKMYDLDIINSDVNISDMQQEAVK